MDWGTPVPTVRYRGTRPTHQTSGLSGYPAVDIMAPVGTPVVAAEDGVVYRLGSAQGGVSLYMKGRSGADHWYGHLAGYVPKVRGVTSGRSVTVRKGEVLGTIGPHPNGAHLHYGVSGANAAQIASTPNTGRTGTGGGGSEQWWKKIPDVGDIPGVPDVPYVTQDPIESVGSIISNPIGTAKNVWEGVKAPYEILSWVGKNWDRVLEVAAGFILVLVGLILMGRAVGLGNLGRKMPGPIGAVAGAAAAADPIEGAYAQGEQDYLRREARRAGRRDAERRAGAYDPATAEIPY